MSVAWPRVFALLRCVDHLGEAKASRVFSKQRKGVYFYVRTNANAIKNPSRPATNVRTITSLAMLAAIAYVVMLLSKMLPQVSGFLQMDLKDTVICIGASSSDLCPPPSSPSWWPWWRCSPSATPAPSAAS